MKSRNRSNALRTTIALLALSSILPVSGGGSVVRFARAQFLTPQQVLTPQQGSISVVAQPTSTEVGNTISITATISGLGNNAGQPVSFTVGLPADKYVFNPSQGNTDSNGRVTTQFTATVAGSHVITAQSGTLIATTTITLTPGAPAVVQLFSNPVTPTVGAVATITGTVKDRYGNNVADGYSFTFEASRGTVDPGVAGTSSGLITSTISTTVAGPLVVTAAYADNTSVFGVITVTFVPSAPHTVALQAVPPTQSVDGSIALTATVKDEFGNRVPQRVVTFTSDIGVVNPVTATTDANGVASAVLTSTTPGENKTVTVTVRGFESVSATAQVTFTAGAPRAITITAVPTTTSVDGSVTVTSVVRDQYSNTVPGVVVSFTVGGVGSVAPVTKTTGADGVVTAVVTSTVPGVSFITTTVANNPSLNASAQVTFQVGAPFSVVLQASPTTQSVDAGIALTATVLDRYNNRVPGVVVTFTAGLGTVTPQTRTTSSTGIATATLTSTSPGLSVITAEVGSSVSATRVVTFTVGAPSRIVVTALTPQPTTASMLVTATLQDQFGNGVSDRVVTFATSLGSVTPTTRTTGAGGVATATITSAVPGRGAVTVTLTADPRVAGSTTISFVLPITERVKLFAIPQETVVGSSILLSAWVRDELGMPVVNASVRFTPEIGSLLQVFASTDSQGYATRVLGSPTSASTGIVTAALVSNPLLSGTVRVTFTIPLTERVTLTATPTLVTAGNSSVVTVTVKDKLGNPVNGITVAVTTTLGSISQLTGTTTSSGEFTTTISSTVAGTATVKASLLPDPTLSGTIEIVFVPGDPATLTLEALPSVQFFEQPIVLSATVVDEYGNLVPNKIISFTKVSGVGVVSPTTTTTGGGGVALATITTTQPGTATVRAIVSGFLNVSDTRLITFVVRPENRLRLFANPASVEVGSASVITAKLIDQFAQPITNSVISFSSNLGTITPLTFTTDNSGVATATLTSNAAGVARVQGVWESDPSVSGTVDVVFTPGGVLSVVVSAEPTTIIVANGISSTLVVVTVTDQFGNPVPDLLVNFSAGIGRFSPQAVRTNSRGVATSTLTSTVPGSERVTVVAGGVSASIEVTYTNPPASQAPLQSDLTVITQAVRTVRKGDLITYVITLTNTGAGQINNILIVAPIPDGTTFVPGSASGGNYGGSSYPTVLEPQAVQSAVTWSGNLAPGASHTLRFAVRVNILQGTVTFTPRIYVDTEDTGINLSSTLLVEPVVRLFLPIVSRP